MRSTYLFFLSFFFVLSSCTETIEFDLNDSNSRIVIDGVITTELKRHLVQITSTASYYDDNNFDRISGASVSISDGENNFELEEVADGFFFTDSIAGQIGKTYSLTVVYEGEIYSASSLLEPVANLDSIIAIQLFDTIPIINEVDSSYSIGIAISETPGIGDNYLFKYYINGLLETDSVSEYSYTTDEFIDGITFGFPPVISVYQIEHTNVDPGDIITLEASSISRDYVDYLTAILIQTEFRGSIFDGPASNVGGNISGGAMGYFRASDVSTAETLIE